MHRNLKPDNLLFTSASTDSHPTLKLSDFALSRISVIPHFAYTPEDPKERERSGREARRLWYRAPEMLLRKKHYSFEIDMWATGCIMAELALGEAMFNGESEIEQLFKIYRITGTPNEELMSKIKEGSDNDMLVLPKWERVYFGNICFP
jgi:serine/threonine protein kinase